MHLKDIVITFIFSFTCTFCCGQVVYKARASSDFQYGFSFKVSGTIEAKCLQVNASVNAGIGAEVTSFLYPTYHLQLQLYNGGMGTSLKKPKAWPMTFDAAHSLTITTGFDRPYRWMDADEYLLRNSPLYHFSDFSSPALQNPYNYSFSLGTNLIQALGPHRQRFQRAGYFNVHVGLFQLAYSNDGTPFGKWLADGKDRYYTGDGFIAINLPLNWEVNTYTLSYHKFTGYYNKAFEVANGLYLANVDYKDTIQQYFNRSTYNFSVSSLDRGVSLSFNLRNKYFKDIQHLIHLNDYWVLHQVPYPYRIGLSASWIRGISHLIPLK